MEPANNLQKFIFKFELPIFFILTFIISWILWLISGVLQQDYQFRYDNHWLISQVGVFGPALAAMILISIHKNKWWLRLLLITIPTFLLGIYIASFSKEKILQLSLTPKWLLLILAVVIIFYLYRKQKVKLNNDAKRLSGIPITGWILLSILLIPVAFTIIWFIMHPFNTVRAVSIFDGNYVEFATSLLFIFSMNFIFGGSLGEEFGWRGFGLDRVLAVRT